MACRSCDSRLVSTRDTYAEALERMDGPLARKSMAWGAALGALLGWLALPLDLHDASPLAESVASLVRGGMTGFVVGPLIAFAARAILNPVDEEKVDWGQR
jgi:hypothetical protein